MLRRTLEHLYLETLHVTRDIPPLVDALSSMISLKELVLLRDSLGGVSLYSFIALIQRHKHHLLPSLEELSLYNSFVDAADAKRFFEVVTMNEAFSSLNRLSIDDDGGIVEPHLLASAFAGGAFAGLESLSLRGFDGPDDGFAALCQALEANPCAGALKKLSFLNCNLGPKCWRALGALFAHNVLPCLEKLHLFALGIEEDIELMHLAEGFRAAGRPLPLSELIFSRFTMTDADLKVLLSVIESGCLPQLNGLVLLRDCIFDAGIIALSQTLQGGHLSGLECLQLSSNEMKPETICLLAKAVLIHCPRLQTLGLPPLTRQHQDAVQEILRDRKHLEIRFTGSKSV